jgi:hypothetical protein
MKVAINDCLPASLKLAGSFKALDVGVHGRASLWSLVRIDLYVRRKSLKK